jgi:hypothetical protein
MTLIMSFIAGRNLDIIKRAQARCFAREYGYPRIFPFASSALGTIPVGLMALAFFVL